MLVGGSEEGEGWIGSLGLVDTNYKKQKKKKKREIPLLNTLITSCKHLHGTHHQL